MMLSGKHLHDLSPHLTMAHPSLSTAQRQPADLTEHSADDEVSHDSPSLASPLLSGWVQRWILVPSPGSMAGPQ